MADPLYTDEQGFWDSVFNHGMGQGKSAPDAAKAATEALNSRRDAFVVPEKPAPVPAPVDPAPEPAPEPKPEPIPDPVPIPVPVPEPVETANQKLNKALVMGRIGPYNSGKAGAD